MTSKNAYRSIIDFTSSDPERYPTESSNILVESSNNCEVPDAVVFIAMCRPGMQELTYAYLTDDEVTDLIDALTYWRDHS